ncbi:MAG TPA: LPS biosynthesis protein WbpP [Armatimonadetes bacterium]|nr:LPS biosynthesis protein WbpP [Armatimonadota bacterium]
MPCFVVTGGGGFIGSHIVRTLLDRGDSVRVVDDFSTGKRENLAEVEADIDLHVADIRNLEALRPVFEGADYVLHQGAIPSVPRSVQDPISSHEANCTGTLNVLIAARDAGVKRVVQASSSSVYGSNPALPKVETMRPMPISPYAATKLTQEAYASAFYGSFGLETVSLRYFNVFGPRQDPKSQYAAVIPIFCTKLLANQSPTIYGDGEQTRDFTYVANVVQANIKAAEATDGAGGAFNIACGQRLSLNDLLARLCAIMGADIEAIYEPERVGDVKHSLADISAAQAAFGYEPSVDFDEGLRRTAEFFSAGA